MKSKVEKKSGRSPKIANIDADITKLGLVDSEYAIIQTDKEVEDVEYSMMQQEKELIEAKRTNVEIETTYIDEFKEVQDTYNQKRFDYDQAEHDSKIEMIDLEGSFEENLTEKVELLYEKAKA